MSAAPEAVVALGALAVFAFAQRSKPVRRASWDVPPVQRQHAEKLLEAASLYRAGRNVDARTVLRDRALDWGLIARAAAAHPLDPVAHRIAVALDRDGMGAFIAELHARLSPADRDQALTVLADSLTDFTDPTDIDHGSHA